jgi:hypothetical protein
MGGVVAMRRPRSPSSNCRTTANWAVATAASRSASCCSGSGHAAVSGPGRRRGGGEVSGLTLLRQFLIAALPFVIIAVVARPVFRTALSWAAHARSAELFLLCS